MTESAAVPAQDRAIPRAVKGLSLVSLLNDFASELVYPLLPAFITTTLGGGAFVLGALDGAAELTSAALKWVSGRLADRRGWRGPLILVGYAIAVLVRPLIATASAAWQVVGLRVADRIGKGLRTPPRDALIGAVTPLGRRGRAFGFQRAADHLGAVVGSVAAWYLLERGMQVRSVIAWSVVPGVVAFLILLGVLARAGRAAVEPRAPTHGMEPAALPRWFWPPVLTLAILTLARLPETLLLLRLQEQGVAVALVPLVWAGLHVVRSAGSYPGGWLADRLGPRAAVAAGGAVFAVAALALGRFLGPELAVAAFLGLGIVAGLTESAERVLVAGLVPEAPGRAFGAYHALTGVAALPAGLLFGAIYQRAGAGAAFGASAALVLAAVIVWLGLSLPRSPDPVR